MWSQQQINYHKIAAKRLIHIKDLTFVYIRNHKTTSEYEVQQYILKMFNKFNLRSDKYPPIVSLQPAYFRLTLVPGS